MNIVMVGENYYPNVVGGAEMQALRRAEGLVNMGFKVHVISFDGTAGTTEETINGVKITRYSLMTHKARMLSLLMPVATALLRHRHESDLYHIYGTFALVGGGLYKIMGGRRPIIGTLENYGGFCPIGTSLYGNCNLLCRYHCLRKGCHNLMQGLIALPYASVYPFLTSLFKKADLYIAVSEYVKQEYTRYGFSSERIVVVPNSIDVNSNRRDRVPHDGINILYVGRMIEVKGVDLLIRAFHRISKIFKDVKLILVGDGPMLSSYRAMVKEIGLEHNVTFTGHLTYQEVTHYYSIADIFVHPAVLHEPMNLTLLEAMVHDVPVLVSNVGSLGQIVRDAGIIFNRGDVDDLTNKLATLIEDRSKINELRLNCSAVVREYSDHKILKRLVEVYEAVYDG